MLYSKASFLFRYNSLPATMWMKKEKRRRTSLCYEAGVWFVYPLCQRASQWLLAVEELKEVCAEAQREVEIKRNSREKSWLVCENHGVLYGNNVHSGAEGVPRIEAAWR